MEAVTVSYVSIAKYIDAIKFGVIVPASRLVNVIITEKKRNVSKPFAISMVPKVIE